MEVKPLVRLVNPSIVPEVLARIGWMGSVSTGLDNIDEARMEKIGQHCLESGHFSTSRAVQFIFEISGVSRRFSHQFVREKMGVEPVQKSQRYVKEKDFNYIKPNSIGDKLVEVFVQGDPYFLTYEDLMSIAEQAYSGYLEQGVKPEDASFVLGGASETAFHVAVSFEALARVAGNRLCKRAQWEAQDVIGLMVDEVVKRDTRLAPYFQVKCKKLGYCPEKKGCGLMPKKADVLDGYHKYTELLRRVRELQGTHIDVIDPSMVEG